MEYETLSDEGNEEQAWMYLRMGGPTAVRRRGS